METKDGNQSKGAKRRSRNLLLLSISLLIGFGIFELMLRLIPLHQTSTFSSVKYVSDKDVGYLPVALQDAEFNLGFLHNRHIRSNSLGFRGPEWSETKRPKIALLGDSFLHALTISDEFHIATRLQSVTGGEIWNTGVSGYGTYQELLVWRRFLKARKPEITILFFYPENDIRDNHCGLCRAENQLHCPCLSVEEEAIVEDMDFEIRKQNTGIRSWLTEHCYTYRLLRYYLKSEPEMPANYFEKESFAYNVYRPGLSAQWDEAWIVTEWSLRELKRECDSAGSQLLIVSVPGVIQLATDFDAELTSQIGSAEVPSDFDLKYPMDRLRTIADSAGIPLLDLQADFISYRDQYQLRNPVFGWKCDGHWNPLGHRLAADLVYNFLVEQGWIKGNQQLTPSPEEVLGNEMMEKIYSGRTVVLD